MTATLRRMILWTTPYLGWILLSAALGTATVASGVGLLTTSAYLISAAALQPSIAALQVAIVGVRFFGISRGVFRYLERLVSHRTTLLILKRIRTWTYKNLEPILPTQRSKYHSGDLLTRAVSDVETLEDFYVRALSPTLIALCTGLLASAFLWSWDPRLAGLLALGFLAAGLILPAIQRQRARGPNERLAVLRGELQTRAVDLLQNLGDLTAFGRAQNYAEGVRALTRNVTELQERLASQRGLFDGLAALAGEVTALAALTLAIRMVNADEMPGVLLAALTVFVLASFEAVANLPGAFRSLERARSAAERLFELADAEAAIPQPKPAAPRPTRFDLQVCELRFRYAPQEPCALDEISFDLPEGGAIAIVGPSGAGKSTLVNVLSRLWEFESGDVALGGRDLQRLESEHIWDCTSVLEQAPRLFTGTVRENLQMASPHATQQQMERAARAAHILAWIQGLPQGFDSWLGEGGHRLSAGERQRLALARTLLKGSPILILDEPTAHLDPQTENAVLESLTPIIHERTSLLISHRLAGLEAFDQVLVLQHGRIAERGTHHELLQARGLYHRMYTLQRRTDALEVASSRA